MSLGQLSSIYSIYKAFKSKSNLEDFSMPEFHKDEYYETTQDDLYDLASKMVEGNLEGTSFEGIGEQGSDEFLKALDLSTAKTTEAAMESAAATGRRGGAVTSKVAEAVGESTTKMTYADYLTALEGKKGLLDSYTNILSGVRGGALSAQSQRNYYNLGRSNLSLNYLKALDSAELGIGQAQGEAISGLVDSTEIDVNDLIKNILN